MLLAMSEDIRVIIIKLADRLHNMRTHRGCSRRRSGGKKPWRHIEVYAPMAHRLGIRAVKEELEDLGIRHAWTRSATARLIAALCFRGEQRSEIPA